MIWGTGKRMGKLLNKVKNDNVGNVVANIW